MDSRALPAKPGLGKFGMWLFLASLAMIFFASITGYVYVRLEADEWPPAGAPALPQGLWLSTAVIVASSATMQRALGGVRKGDQKALRFGMWVTLGLGVLFLAMQWLNWTGPMLATVGKNARNLYGFTYYMLTVLHALHVIGGLILLTFVARKAQRGLYSPSFHPGVLYSAMYWHFLDAIWLLMFGALLVCS